MEWIVAISVIASSAVSITHAIISYKKSRVPPPDPVWDAALQITLANGMPDADSFAQTYQELFQSTSPERGTTRFIAFPRHSAAYALCNCRVGRIALFRPFGPNRAAGHLKKSVQSKPSTSAIRFATSTEGRNFPFSMRLIVTRETQLLLASSCCVMFIDSLIFFNKVSLPLRSGYQFCYI